MIMQWINYREQYHDLECKSYPEHYHFAVMILYYRTVSRLQDDDTVLKNCITNMQWNSNISKF